MHVQINREHPEIAAELEEQEKRRLKNKRRKSKTDFRQSKSDFEKLESDSGRSVHDFDLHSNEISNTPSIKAGERVSDLDIELIYQWLRTINPERTRSDALAYIQKRSQDEQPTPELATRLAELRTKNQKQILSKGNPDNQAIASRFALTRQILGGDA